MKRTQDVLSTTQRKEAFFEALADAQERLSEKGIDYRVIGSLAVHAHLGDKATEEGLRPLDFDRDAVIPDRRVPDIDLVVPRVDLPGAREVRTEMMNRNQPVKLGLANPATEFDFLPDQGMSYLTHKQLALPVASELFRPVEAMLEGVAVQTIPVDTLAHTYGTFGGRVRQKDLPALKALIRTNDQLSDPRTDVFHTFQRERRRMSPGQHTFALTLEQMMKRMPSRVEAALFRTALKAADVLGKR